MSELILETPVFGRCRLVPHSADEAPQSLPVLGYVELEGTPGRYLAAMNLRGEWRTHKNRKLTAKVLRWFHLERISDDSPALGH